MGGKSRRTVPKAVRHKRILDIAEEQPDASLSKIAAEVPSATEDLVDNILNEYGDPGIDESHNEADEDDSGDVDQPQTAGPDGAESGEGGDDVSYGADTTPPNMDKKQRKTLRAIYENPEMTQSGLGEVLGVSNSTVCNRLNSIEGFDWGSRQEFAESVFNSQGGTKTAIPETMSSNDSEQTEKSVDLEERVVSLEKRLENGAIATEKNPGIKSPELTHKVIHACMESDNISEEEELQILKEML